MMNIKYFKFTLSCLMIGLSLISSIGCKKFVEADLPIDKTTSQLVFDNTSAASTALSYVYYSFYDKIAIAGASGASVMNGLTADELVLHDESNLFLESLFTNSLSSKELALNSYWNTCFELIFRVNSIIEGVERSTGIPVSSKNELIGQSKFLRAFVYFYLVNLYGGVPLVTGTDYKINTLLARSTEPQVYEQIIKDLIEAQALVSDSYLKSDLITITTERVTANKAVVSAFLARVYLYTEKWQKAEDEASKLINDPKYSIPESLNAVFLINSDETIWQIEGNISAGDNSPDGTFFIPEFPGIIPTVYFSEYLLDEIDVDDQRGKDWMKSETIGTVNYYYPFKYKQRTIFGSSVTTEYNMMLRLAEQYLIRAEARAHLSNLNGAIEDLNVIRKRAKVPLYTSLEMETLLQNIAKERQVELFSECGHRWFDLKRTGKADEVLGPIKGENWQTTDKLFPIPSSEFLYNPNLRGHQNPGYTEN